MASRLAALTGVAALVTFFAVQDRGVAAGIARYVQVADETRSSDARIDPGREMLPAAHAATRNGVTWATGVLVAGSCLTVVVGRTGRVAGRVTDQVTRRVAHRG